MATVPLFSPLAASNPEAVGPNIGVPKSSFLSTTKLFLSKKPHPRKPSVHRCCKSPFAQSLDHIPKQFRQENLKDGLMDNFKNVPQSLYGLSPSQMEMFMTEDSPFRRQSGKVTEESISSARSYLDNGGMWTMSSIKARGHSNYSMSASMYQGGGRGYGRPGTAPPDLPSLLLDARICFLGMPIVPEVTELIVAQLMWLQFDDPSKPIFFYINSSGTLDEDAQLVGSETDAYAIADALSMCSSKIYTLNFAMAFGQAAMLLSLGDKGCRGVQAHSYAKLYLPKIYRSSGAVTDMWIKAKELDVHAEYYIELLAEGTGKTIEEITEDLQRPRHFGAQEAIDYGLADKIIDSTDIAIQRQNRDEKLAQSKAMMRGAIGGTDAAPLDD
ncbi:ATP-dependent Clp protease proteolytic subunit-related protein 1, chloroplastic [Durio zibethinus]|uniref:ATP-dependent Clp protease proteolytic subunit n=1 Tax=Durio zibethinus TaxID=66656 RepID=A0A6P6AFC1_DURZI|nr:ATP-dependent Clp protease proteolytic subunit-related protein 1, chloroplastic [Durio zibethinus]